MIRSVKQFYDLTIGRSFDTDHAYGAQCWDYFDYFCQQIGFEGSRACSATGYAGDIWMLRDTLGYDYSKAFDYVTNPAEFKSGDWVFWSKHVALYYTGMEVGQNQPDPYVTEKSMNWNGILGAMRWRGWQDSAVQYGRSTITLNGRSYELWRMSGRDQIGVLSPGLNKTATLPDMDADGISVEAKATGANYFQMREDIPDQPYGTTYGDISAPISGVYQSLPNQDSTLFYDLTTGEFGDCSGVVINSSHNVFSPSMVWPNSKGHWEYATMVGLSHTDLKSWYTFVIRFADGYAVGIAQQESTPQEIADDFSATDMVNIAFLDGGGSAQAAFWNGTRMDYVRDENRACASAIAIYRVPEQPAVIIDDGAQNQTHTDETEKDEDQPMPAVTPQEPAQITPTEGWKDPDDGKITVYDRIVALLAVKSIITVVCLALFAFLVVHEKITQDQFMTVFSVVIAFYFGTTYAKGGGK